RRDVPEERVRTGVGVELEDLRSVGDCLALASQCMRILHVSDLYYTLKQFDWVASVAGDYELVVVAGHVLAIASVVEPAAQIAAVLECLARIAAQSTVVVCSGNHDLNARNKYDERSAPWLATASRSHVLVDGARLDTTRVMVTVCPWWDGPRTRAE